MTRLARTALSALLLTGPVAAPAAAEVHTGATTLIAGAVVASDVDERAEAITGTCAYTGQMTASGQLQYQLTGVAVATSNSQSQPELTVIGCRLISPAQGLPGEQPTLTSEFEIGCPGAVCATVRTVVGWPARPMVVCVFGQAYFGPFPLVQRWLQQTCSTMSVGDGLIGCDDGLDNDADGYSDVADPGCAGPADQNERGTAACDDGVDNDNDLLADEPLDPGCAGPADPTEQGSTTCDDGLDNDGDGQADFPRDPGCSGHADGSERGTTACDDGVDNDGDGSADHPADGGCRTPADPNETTIP
jgi:hypothetical protein